MGNTVGSINTDFWNLKTKDDAYIVGLWCADGYHRTSSIGISNTKVDLINKFKRRTKAYHLYVNSRPLLRKFREFKNNILKFISKDMIFPYMAGRFDGDGSVAKDFYRDCRIVYSNLKEAKKDLMLMNSLGFKKMKIYNYRSAKTFCLYFSRLETHKFLSLIYPYSLRLQKSVFVPRRDLI